MAWPKDLQNQAQPSQQDQKGLEQRYFEEFFSRKIKLNFNYDIG